MANYPTSNPSIPNAGAQLSTNPHSVLHDSMRDEILAICTELGLSPSAGYATVKARLDDMQTRRGCTVTRSTNQTLTGGSAVDTVTYTTEVEDTNSYIAVTSGTVTIPAGFGGVYAITFSYETDAASLNVAEIVAGGVTYAIEESTDGRSGTIVVALAAADTISTQLSSPGSAANITSARLSVYRVSV